MTRQLECEIRFLEITAQQVGSAKSSKFCPVITYSRNSDSQLNPRSTQRQSFLRSHYYYYCRPIDVHGSCGDQKEKRTMGNPTERSFKTGRPQKRWSPLSLVKFRRCLRTRQAAGQIWSWKCPGWVLMIALPSIRLLQHVTRLQVPLCKPALKSVELRQSRTPQRPSTSLTISTGDVPAPILQVQQCDISNHVPCLLPLDTCVNPSATQLRPVDFR